MESESCTDTLAGSKLEDEEIFGFCLVWEDRMHTVANY